MFHASQIEDITFPVDVAVPPLPQSEQCNEARRIMAGMPSPPVFKEGSAVPCYRKATDSVHMPDRSYFVSEETFFSTLFHETAHFTGHSSRLARASLMDNKGMDATGDTSVKVYAEEELVAEMAASFLCASASIAEGELKNSAAYLQSWIDALKSKDAKGWIIRAAAQAQKAASYIMNVQSESPT